MPNSPAAAIVNQSPAADHFGTVHHLSGMIDVLWQLVESKPEIPEYLRIQILECQTKARKAVDEAEMLECAETKSLIKSIRAA